MKGYFCIYECSQNKWLMDGHWWQLDRDFTPVHMATQTNLTDYKNSDGDTKYQISQTNYKDVVTVGNNIIRPYSIKRFDTMTEAEEYLTERAFPTSMGEFYSIRKIYF